MWQKSGAGGRWPRRCSRGRACVWAVSVGQPVVQLYVTANNERALRFYRQEGFQQTQAILRKVLT